MVIKTNSAINKGCRLESNQNRAINKISFYKESYLEFASLCHFTFGSTDGISEPGGGQKG